MRVDHLHPATAHPKPLYHFCRKRNFSGRITHWRNGTSRVPLAMPLTCTACDGTGHAKTYPAIA
ncbi:hypothetical protein ACWCQQ_38170 [Streptomyces sp. NPDC002143]